LHFTGSIGPGEELKGILRNEDSQKAISNSATRGLSPFPLCTFLPNELTLVGLLLIARLIGLFLNSFSFSFFLLLFLFFLFLFLFLLNYLKVAKFKQERDIMLLASAHENGPHPWLTSLYCSFQDETQLYLVMDYHPGGDLLTLMSKYDDVLPEDVAQFYIAEIICGVQAVHKMGYLHRFTFLLLTFLFAR
jgi:serine/threonine protein kinase